MFNSNKITADERLQIIEEVELLIAKHFIDDSAVIKIPEDIYKEYQTNSTYKEYFQQGLIQSDTTESGGLITATSDFLVSWVTKYKLLPMALKWVTHANELIAEINADQIDYIVKDALSAFIKRSFVSGYNALASIYPKNSQVYSIGKDTLLAEAIVAKAVNYGKNFFLYQMADCIKQIDIPLVELVLKLAYLRFGNVSYEVSETLKHGNNDKHFLQCRIAPNFKGDGVYSKNKFPLDSAVRLEHAIKENYLDIPNKTFDTFNDLFFGKKQNKDLYSDIDGNIKELFAKSYVYIGPMNKETKESYEQLIEMAKATKHILEMQLNYADQLSDIDFTEEQSLLDVYIPHYNSRSKHFRMEFTTISGKFVTKDYLFSKYKSSDESHKYLDYMLSSESKVNYIKYIIQSHINMLNHRIEIIQHCISNKYRIIFTSEHHAGTTVYLKSFPGKIYSIDNKREMQTLEEKTRYNAITEIFTAEKSKQVITDHLTTYNESSVSTQAIELKDRTITLEFILDSFTESYFTHMNETLMEMVDHNTLKAHKLDYFMPEYLSFRKQFFRESKEVLDYLTNDHYNENVLRTLVPFDVYVIKHAHILNSKMGSENPVHVPTRIRKTNISRKHLSIGGNYG